MNNAAYYTITDYPPHYYKFVLMVDNSFTPVNYVNNFDDLLKQCKKYNIVTITNTRTNYTTDTSPFYIAANI